MVCAGELTGSYEQDIAPTLRLTEDNIKGDIEAAELTELTQTSATGTAAPMLPGQRCSIRLMSPPALSGAFSFCIQPVLILPT
jgi:hypothetical protein